MIQPWPTQRTEKRGSFRIFDIRSDFKTSPRTGNAHDFFVIECPNWVNVVAITPSQEVVMVEQYRHGSDTIELEIPGGMMDPTDSSPLEAGARELREETGYEGQSGRLIGSIFPNPAIMNNTCYTVLFEQCEKRHETELDPGEDLETKLIPLADIPKLVQSGRIRHALVAVALTHYQLDKREAAS